MMKKDLYDTICDALVKEYSFVKQLHKSPVGEVLVYRHNSGGKRLVVKKMYQDPGVYRELARFHHKNLPETYDTAFRDGCCLVLEEYIEGVTVADVLENGIYTKQGVRRVIIPVLDALSVLHRRNIIHRDIKPENIMITNDGDVKLVDFNAAKLYRRNNNCDTENLGTSGYAAPEQYGIAQSDRRSDIYAIGVLMNVMLTGMHPSEKMCKGRYGRIIRKCTYIDRNARYQSVEQIIRELRRC